MEDAFKLMEDAEMLADVKAYDAAKARLENGEDETHTAGDDGTQAALDVS
jgi:hypothetical protein